MVSLRNRIDTGGRIGALLRTESRDRSPVRTRTRISLNLDPFRLRAFEREAACRRDHANRKDAALFVFEDLGGVDALDPSALLERE